MLILQWSPDFLSFCHSLVPKFPQLSYILYVSVEDKLAHNFVDIHGTQNMNLTGSTDALDLSL